MTTRPNQLRSISLFDVMRLTSFIALVTLLCGCTTFPKRNTGQFNASNGDFIVIKRDGALYWSPIAKARNKLRFIGMVTPEKNSNRFRLVVPSASPFLNSSIGFSPDYSHVTVNWGEGQTAEGAPRGRATDYERAITK